MYLLDKIQTTITHDLPTVANHFPPSDLRQENTYVLPHADLLMQT